MPGGAGRRWIGAAPQTPSYGADPAPREGGARWRAKRDRSSEGSWGSGIRSSLRGLQQLAGMAAGGRVVAVGAEHPNELSDELGAAKLGHGRRCRASRHVFDDREVAIGEGGDLREVGDADHLAAGGELAQLLADRA